MDGTGETMNGSTTGEPALSQHQNGAHQGWPTLDAKPNIDRDASSVLTPEQAMRLRCVPYAVEGTRLHVAMLNPDDFGAADEVSVVANRSVKRFAAPAEMIQQLIREAYGTTAAEVAARLGSEEGSGDDLIANLEAVDADELHRMAEQPTLINLVNLIILEAVRGRASDVHIEPFERDLKVKYRIDGVLVEQTPPPKQLQPAITSRVKIMAGMNIAERYVPQDGHITLRFEGRKVDIRVSTVPTIYGESVVMRILDKDAINLDLETLGMRERDRTSMDRLIALPHGMVLVTGPTGSGKTTTLYAALTKLYAPEKKIITIEDPVEYELSGVNQIPVNPKRGLSFASGLRSILRQDPDVIMVGEVRDGETADIAVRSALTGHLLFSTLHTNDAVSAIGRLIDMGVEPFLLASVLEGVLAQRLGRRLCAACRSLAPIPDAELHRLSSDELAMFSGKAGWTANGCDACGGRGFAGRVGFFELLVINSALRAAISERRASHQLLSLASSDHQSMRRDGLVKAADGVTTIDQVLRTTQDAEANGAAH
jgi:type II secretory ATPase GspE/PulE/Tfp pilus assembly ATPase PilB-like protein